MTAENIIKTFTREQFAEHLEKLAKQFREGKLSTSQGEWSIPDSVDVRVKVKEKKGRIESKMGYRWSTLDDYDSKAREEVSDWRDSMKSVKKLMSSSFKELKRSAESGTMPTKETLQGMVDSSEAFMQSADLEWKEAMEEFMGHLKNLEHAIDTGDIEVVLHEIRDLRYREKACHEEYK